jgi:hypothetical protein
MASVSLTAYTNLSVNQSTKKVQVQFDGSFSGFNNTIDAPSTGFEWGRGAYTNSGPVSAITGRFGFPNCGSWASNLFSYIPGQSIATYVLQAELDADRDYQARARVDDYDVVFSGSYVCDNFLMLVTSGMTTFRTWAIDATASAPGSSGITSVQATIACDYYPNTGDSSATVKLQYKRSVDSTWIDAGSSDVVTGYAQLNISRTISSLTPSTQYDVRLTMTRTTVNSTTLTSSTHQFSTLAGAPTITTNPATAITGTTATLNGTVNPNGIATTYWFDYGTTTGYGSSTAAQGPNSGTSPVAFSQAIGPLTAGQLYHFRAHALQGGVDYYGSDLTLFTDTQGHIMPTVYQTFAKYGVQTDFYFCVETKASTGADRFLSAAVPWVAGDVKVDKDGAGLANVTNLPTRIGSTALYKQTLTAAEMQGTRINVLLIDADGPEWRDCHIAILTKLQLGQIDVDATQIGGNTTAMSLVGVGTGYGLFAQGSSGFAAFAQGTSGDGILGRGIGGGYAFHGTNATGNPALIHNFFLQLEGPEPTTAPADNANFGAILQYLKRRETNKVTQTATAQVWYRDNSVDIMTQRTVSDDLVTQVQNKLV